VISVLENTDTYYSTYDAVTYFWGQSSPSITRRLSTPNGEALIFLINAPKTVTCGSDTSCLETGADYGT